MSDDDDDDDDDVLCHVCLLCGIEGVMDTTFHDFVSVVNPRVGKRIHTIEGNNIRTGVARGISYDTLLRVWQLHTEPDDEIREMR